MNANDVLLNQAFCIPIESETAKCHKDLGDGRRNYKDNGIFVLERNGQWYAIPERDEFGNWKGTISWTRFMELQAIFGSDFRPLSTIPNETEVI